MQAALWDWCIWRCVQKLTGLQHLFPIHAASLDATSTHKKRNKQESFSLAGPEDWRAFCLLTLFRWFCLGVCVFPSKLTENGRWSEVLRSLVVGIHIMLNVHNLPFARWVNTRASSLRTILHGCATNLHANLPFCPHEGVATLGECV